MNRKGFTLLELMVVLIVLGALAAAALPKYVSFVEKSRAGEAVTAIGSIKTAELSYAAANTTGQYKTSGTVAIATDLGIDVPTQYWNFDVTGSSNSSFQVTATRINGTFNNNWLKTVHTKL